MTITGILGPGHFRAFGIEGDSMDPTYCAGEIAIAKEIHDWNWIRNRQCYVLVTVHGIYLKRCMNKLNTEGKLECHSDNDYYDPYDIPLNEILEVWEVRASISKGSKAPHPAIAIQKRLTELELRSNNTSST